MPTFKLSVLSVLTELSSLAVVTDATACLAAVQLEDLTVVLVVFSQPASHLTDIDGFVFVSDISHVLLVEQIYHWFQLPSDRMRIEIFILNQSDHLAGPVHQAEKTKLSAQITYNGQAWAGLGCYQGQYIYVPGCYSTFQQ